MLAALLGLTLSCRPDNGHYFFSGPLSDLMVEGSATGASTSGLPVTITLTEKGAKIAGEDSELKGPMWAKPIHIHFTGGKFEGGHLTGKVGFKNESGQVLEGLRLDVAGATETYSDGGQVKTRGESALISSPILFGDLQEGDSADAQAVDVSGLTFSDASKQLDVTFKLSGVAALGGFKVGDNCNPGQLSVDPKGRVYVTEHNSGLWRTDADGTKPQLLAKWGDGADFAMFDPATSDLVGHELNTHRIVIYSQAGEEKGKIPASEDFGPWPSGIRTNGNGTYLILTENKLNYFKDGKVVKTAEDFGGVTLTGDTYFDVAPDGSIFVYSEQSIYKVDPALTSAKKVAFGPDWHLGRVTNVKSVRVDSSGNIYVLEDHMNDWAEWPRISVFDHNGHFVRVFGRAGRAPSTETDTFLPGEIGKNNYDIAFGPDGRIYVSGDVEFGKVLMFMPF